MQVMAGAAALPTWTSFCPGSHAQSRLGHDRQGGGDESSRERGSGEWTQPLGSTFYKPETPTKILGMRKGRNQISPCGMDIIIICIYCISILIKYKLIPWTVRFKSKTDVMNNLYSV